MTLTMTRTLRRLLPLLAAALLVIPGTGNAVGLPGFGGGHDAQPSADQKPDPKQLSSSLDDVISTLENDKKRTALVDHLKQLRQGMRAEAKNNGPISGARGGLLGALSDSISNLGEQTDDGDSPWAIWQRNARKAAADIQSLFEGTRKQALISNGAEIVFGLIMITSALVVMTLAGHRLFARRGWPTTLPPEPRPWMLLAHFLRRVTPWVITFAALLIAIHLIQPAAAASATLLVLAYIGLCGRLLSTVFDVVIALFTRGHRRVAVAILHAKALGPLFFIGALVAFGDAVNSARLSELLGDHLADWLSVVANMLAGLGSGALIIRIRRPVQHLIRNRTLANRRDRGGFRELISIGAQFWHVPALLLVAASLTAIFITGGQAHAAFARAMIGTVLFVLTLVATGIIRRQHERAARRPRKSPYAGRFRKLGFTLAHGLAWLVFAELSVRVWGFSLFGIGERGVVGGRIGQALLGLGLTVVIAWLVWIVIDTAIERALHGRRRNTNRAQTITPMIRNLALFVIIVVAGIAGLAAVGVNVTPLLAGAGVIGIALGFGAQSLVADLITGIFILIEDSLAVGDFVEINGYMGTVEGLNLRAVRLRDLDGVVHITTFSHIDAIHNMSRQFGIALIKIRIPHELAIDDAIELMRRTAADLQRDPFMRGLIRSHLEMQGIHEFDNGSPILRMRLRTAPEYQWDVSRAFNLALKRRMETEYVNLGAPRMSVSMEAGGGARYAKRGKSAESDTTTTMDWPTDDQASPDPG
ncbi:mechanosensitive ion channel family protein [Salinisphaera sp.]|uniref:mechanosensitive ion channel family protein n=1 Tax=Salinisphaera sp. TaxID=1914330 RepID=UPI002D76D251|nr:mechanosensitive ion channel family protein [Salinisphaera sp.]HET7314768.1 mechanosensitive ion channel family protein [Salinisphaera sp.]